MTIDPSRFGLTPEQWQELQSQLFTPLKQAGAQIWIFGSRARGDFRPYSDLDLMIESSGDISPTLAQVREYFEKSNFPFKLDLVQKTQFATSYLGLFNREKVEV